MVEPETDRRRERRRADETPAPLQHDAHPVLALQRAMGNHAVTRVLARAPVVRDAVHIPGVGDIKVVGGNLQEWLGAETPSTVDITSQQGRHSAKLEKLSHERTTHDAKVTIAPPFEVGQHLDVGGTVLEITGARIEHYAVADGVETWRLGGSMNVHRVKTTHRAA